MYLRNERTQVAAILTLHMEFELYCLLVVLLDCFVLVTDLFIHIMMLLLVGLPLELVVAILCIGGFLYEL